ncbi:MAG: hypothetical protein KVP17_001609 [Porospora cf. gigantea B]|uniref:uncharacterized protein n=1 Tax=Porospora cf. gigantea B TaxID=2853592 RepID=UPI003571A84B|nr:MAG: hypothetical protein KVP17_001609 [Porospora cf. gigantea B]
MGTTLSVEQAGDALGALVRGERSDWATVLQHEADGLFWRQALELSNGRDYKYALTFLTTVLSKAGTKGHMSLEGITQEEQVFVRAALRLLGLLVAELHLQKNAGKDTFSLG